jgi:hypothetical protein
MVEELEISAVKLAQSEKKREMAKQVAHEIKKTFDAFDGTKL